MRRDVFQAIADPVRRDILDLLSDGSLAVNDIAENFSISRQAVSKHIKILDECGLISISKRGRARYCKINPKSLVPAFIWLEQYERFWEERIDSFADYITSLKSKSDKK